MTIIHRFPRKTRGATVVDHLPGFGRILVAEEENTEGLDFKEESFKAIVIDADFPKIPSDTIHRIASLYVHMLAKRNTTGGTDSQKEVSVVFLRNFADPTQWRVLVPRQVVGGASVEANFLEGLCDIETGEEVKDWPPDGWYHAGSSHSHNTMGAFFSSTDDRSELPVPGIHFVFGNFKKVEGEETTWTWQIATSMVYRGRRFTKVVNPDQSIRDMDPTDIMEAQVHDTSSDPQFHPRVMEYVKTCSPIVSTSVVSGYLGYVTGHHGRDHDYYSGNLESYRRQKSAKNYTSEEELNLRAVACYRVNTPYTGTKESDLVSRHGAHWMVCETQSFHGSDLFEKDIPVIVDRDGDPWIPDDTDPYTNEERYVLGCFVERENVKEHVSEQIERQAYSYSGYGTDWGDDDKVLKGKRLSKRERKEAKRAAQMDKFSDTDIRTAVNVWFRDPKKRAAVRDSVRFEIEELLRREPTKEGTK